MPRFFSAGNLYKRLSPLLRPLSGPYARIMRQRRAFWSGGAAFRPSRPCVSVGNIAWGGSGKTPLVDWMLSWAEGLLPRPLRVVVLTRGYGASPGPSPLPVTPQTPVAQAGDEPLLLARAHPAARILSFPRRAQAARFAEARLDPDLFLLDDGMQHLAVARQADLVLLRPEDVADQWNRVIPAGSWREDASALAAASAFLMKISPGDLEDIRPLITARLAAFNVPFFSFSLRISGLRPLCPDSSAPLPPEALRGKPYLLISGVAGPEQVEATARSLTGLAPARHLAFADHHPYTARDVQGILRAADGQAADLPILCTAKDGVKLLPFRPLFHSHPLLTLEAEVVFGPALFTAGSFPLWWEDWWQRHGRP
ncbi:MAG: tetraacyldisaccharide 4'-kinase [Desulfovibrio sp.]|nr:tetraacyldisaccharide 4'-kinase [Desulfovibrio sp.]